MGTIWIWQLATGHSKTFPKPTEELTHTSHTVLFPLVMFLHKHVRRLLALSEARVDSYNQLLPSPIILLPGHWYLYSARWMCDQGLFEPPVNMAHTVLSSLKIPNVWIMTYWGWKCLPSGKISTRLSKILTQSFRKYLFLCHKHLWEAFGYVW